MPVLLYLNDEKLTLRDKRAEDEQGTLWWKAEALDEKNLPIVGWVSNKREGVKKVSAWDWFDFTQLTENASLLEFYKNVALSEKRNKDAPSLDKYKPTLKAALSVLDRQYPTETKQYAYIEDKCFRGIIEKPILFEALGRLLVNYESEWYSEIDTKGKMPKWESLNSVMTEDAENVLGYLRDGDEAKLNIYLSNKGLSQNSEEALMLKNQQEKVCKMPTDYYEKKESLLTPNELALYLFMKHLEKQVAIWQQEKEKIKQCLWWDDVVKGLANQNQPMESKTTTKNKEGSDTSTTKANSTRPATLSQNGKVWYMHPIEIMKISNNESYINDEGFICNNRIIQYQVKNLERGDNIGGNTIVLHRTFSKGSAISLIDNAWKSSTNMDNIGAHFVIDKDGTTYQVVSLKKYANHVGKIRPRCNLTGSCDKTYKSKTLKEIHLSEVEKDYPERYPYNKDSIGIEVVAWWDKDTQLWDDATPEQLKSIKDLVIYLQKEFNLDDKDLYQHQCIAYKTSGEGKNLYPPADNWNIDSNCY